MWLIPRRCYQKEKKAKKEPSEHVSCVEEEEEHLQETLGSISQSDISKIVASLLHKEQQLLSSPWRKSALKGSRVHLRNFSNTVEQKSLIIIMWKGKENSFILSVSSHPQASFAQHREGTPQLEWGPSRGMEAWVSSHVLERVAKWKPKLKDIFF